MNNARNVCGAGTRGKRREERERQRGRIGESRDRVIAFRPEVSGRKTEEGREGKAGGGGARAGMEDYTFLAQCY